MAIIRDTDLLYVQRGDTPHNWTGLELKSLVSSVAKDGKLIIGNYLTPNGSEYDGSTTLTINVDGTSSSTPDKVVIRDADGSFAGNIISAVGGQFSGNVTVGGELTLSKDPVENLQAATKQYVDSLTGSTGFVFISDTPPPAPSSGDLWWNTSDGTLYVMYEEDDYNDGAGPGTRQWVVTVPTGGEGGSGGGGGAEVLIQEEPPFPDLYPPGTLWWDNSEESAQLYILYNNPPYGKVWVEITSSISTSDEYVLRTGDQMVGDLAMGEKVAQLSGIWKTSGDLLLGGDVFASEPNIYLHATDGSATFVGNVGIGTDSPDRSLHINSGIIDTVAKFESSDSSAIINFVDNGDANGVSVGSVNGNMTFRSGLSTERMRIDSLGNVGIGTTSPETQLHLSAPAADTGYSDIDLRFELGIGYGGQISGYIDQGISHGVTFSTLDAGNVSEKVRVTNGGRVGIGTSTPDFTLDVNGTVGITEGGAVSWHDGSGSLAARIYASTTDELRFETGSGASRSMTIDSSGKVGIGTTSPQSNLVVSNGGAQGIEFSAGTTTDIFAYNRSNSTNMVLNLGGEQITFNTIGLGKSEAARIDFSGRLLVGTSSARGTFYNATANYPLAQIEGTSFATSGLSITRSDNSASGGVLLLANQRSGTLNGNGLVSSEDGLGGISFQGGDGTNLVEGANIFAIVDGTPGANDMPTSLVFSTTADGASSPTERMRIDNAGDAKFTGSVTTPGVVFGTPAGVVTSKTLDDYEVGTWTPVFGAESGTVFVTYDTNATKGWYCKVGNVVHGAFNIGWTAASGSGSILWIGGIPYSYSGSSTFGPVTYQGAVSKCVGVTFANWGGSVGEQAAVGIYSNNRLNLQFFSSGMTTTDQRARFSALSDRGQITAEFKFLVA